MAAITPFARLIVNLIQAVGVLSWIFMAYSVCWLQLIQIIRPCISGPGKMVIIIINVFSVN